MAPFVRETIRVAEVVYLSLGSNVGDRALNLRDAIQRLKVVGAVRRVSTFYETEPVDVVDQPWFLNCVVAIETASSPRSLLESVLKIEGAMGRRRIRGKGPRTIDIDILLYGNHIVDVPGLKIPHPAMQERRFVLEPLAEIAPDAVHPGFKKTAGEMLAELPVGQAVHRWESTRYPWAEG